VTGTEGTRVPPSSFVVASAATIAVGMGMALQGVANGELAGVLGSVVFASTFSFASGLVVLVVVTAASRRGRAGFSRAVRLVRTGEFPWWMTLGGLAGAAVIVAQSLTVPVLGVAVFTMAYVAGQLTGALAIDGTSLPPGGRAPLTVWRVVGTAIVLVGVSISAAGVLAQGVPAWAPIPPFLAGLGTVFQQAFNGRLRAASGSARAATLTNFLVGSVFLVALSVVLLAAGSRASGVPQLPGEAWILLGGTLGVLFIGTTTVTVAHLGVLLLSLMTLVGSLTGSLVIDLTFGSAEADVNAATYWSIAVVVAGVAVTNIPRRRRGITSSGAT